MGSQPARLAGLRLAGCSCTDTPSGGRRHSCRDWNGICGLAGRFTGRDAGIVFVADDLGAWLIGLLADRGRRRLTTVVLGSDQERALRSAATAAVQLTARELRPGDDEQAAQLAMVVSEVFGEPVPGASLAGDGTVLEALQAGIAGQLAVLDDASLTGTGLSSADVLGVGAAELAEKLTARLVREIVVRGSRGGSLFPLASQLNDDVTHLQGQQLKGMLGEVLDRLGDTRAAPAPAPRALAQLPQEWRGSPAAMTTWVCWPGCLTRPGRRNLWSSQRWPGWRGWARRPWRSRRGMPPGGRAGSAAVCCSSICMVMTRHRWSLHRRWMGCCGRWGCPPSTSRPAPSSGPGCTGRSSRRSPSRCW
jgi:hypothetical protein